MSSLFADTHNVIVILEKLDAAEGFEQIINFLSGSYIHYALTVNPHIYISCIKQFWNTASVKRSDDVTRTSGNEFSTAMASAVICLSKGQNFNFSKYIFDSLVRNVDSSSKFYMYPQLIQLIIQNQVGNLSTHSTRFISPALTQKVFANMRWVGKGFSGVEIPLFEGMLAARQLAEEGLAEEQKLEIIKLKARVKRLEMDNKVKSSKLRHLRKVGASRRIESSDDMKDVFNQGRMIDDLDKDKGIELVKDANIAETEGRHAAEQAKKQAAIYHLDLDHSSKVLSMQEDDSAIQEVVEVVTIAKLITDVVTAAASQVSAASVTISAAKPKELSSKTPTETPKVKDKRKGILIETPKPMKKKDQIEMDAEYARKFHEEINKDHEEINKDIDWDAAIDHVNQKSKKEEDQEIIKSINETPAQKAAKRR
nr:hypothetical protein [Tanacetum cinerariifolium]